MNDEFATVHRWALPLVDPLFAIQNMNVYWWRSNPRSAASWPSAMTDVELAGLDAQAEQAWDAEGTSALKEAPDVITPMLPDTHEN